MQIHSLLRILPILACAASAASAQVIFDSAGFESPAYSLGSLAGQNGWGVENAPGNATVIDLGGNQVVEVTGGGATNWYYPTLNYTPAPGSLVVVEADISRTLGTSTSSFGYGIDLYNQSLSRFARAGLVSNGGNIQAFVTTKMSGGVLSASGSATNILVSSATYAADQFVHFKLVLDFATQTFRVELNSVDVGYEFPFVSASTLLADADFQVSTGAGANDRGRFDNYIVSATTPIPEPSSCAALAGLAALGLASLRRRRA